MATFSIIASRKGGLSSCEPDVRFTREKATPGEIISIDLAGLKTEHVILAVLRQRAGHIHTLVCLNWLLHDGQLV